MRISATHFGRGLVPPLMLTLAALGGAHRTGQSAYTLQRTYTVGGSDVYAVTFTETGRFDNPMAETLTETVTALLPDGATMSLVQSKGTHSLKGHVEATTEFNVSASTKYAASGIPAVPTFPSLSPVNVVNLAMQGLVRGISGNAPMSFSVPSGPGSSSATFSGQISLVSTNPGGAEFHVVGDAKSAAGAALEHLDCTFDMPRLTCVITQATMTVSMGAQVVTATVHRTSA